MNRMAVGDDSPSGTNTVKLFLAVLDIFGVPMVSS